MNPPAHGRAFFWLIAVVCLSSYFPAMADVIIGINGERFVGRVIEETTNSIVFESETVGRLTVPRSRVRELQRTPAPQAVQTNQTSLTASNAAWVPPGAGKDGADWLQLKSGEWLRGRLNYIQDKKVQFESDELEDLSLKLKDVRQLYSGEAMFTKFDGRDQVFGTVSLSNRLVQVVGPEQVELPEDLLQGITPGGAREIDFWCAKVNFGLNLQAGNNKQVTENAAAELSRRTPATQFLLDYLGNFSEVEGKQNANDHRVNLTYDVRLNRDWFVRPAQLEYYRDQLANIAHRGTAGVGFGYYLLDHDDLEWKIAAGPGVQYLRFETVEPGADDATTTPAGILQTRFEADLTSRWTFIQTFSSTFTTEQAGLYSHHAVSSLEFEITRTLDVDFSFVWDYLQNPQPEGNGLVPQRNDFRLTLSLGAKF
jgi:putative salt-induced outer membrane protein YdiY